MLKTSEGLELHKVDETHSHDHDHEEDDHDHGIYDPHTWLSIENAQNRNGKYKRRLS